MKHTTSTHSALVPPIHPRRARAARGSTVVAPRPVIVGRTPATYDPASIFEDPFLEVSLHPNGSVEVVDLWTGHGRCHATLELAELRETRRRAEALAEDRARTLRARQHRRAKLSRCARRLSSVRLPADLNHTAACCYLEALARAVLATLSRDERREVIERALQEHFEDANQRHRAGETWHRAWATTRMEEDRRLALAG